MHATREYFPALHTLLIATRGQRLYSGAATAAAMFVLRATCLPKQLARAAQEKEQAVFTFDTHARVFRTGVSAPFSDCQEVAAIESSAAFYSACLSNPVSKRPAGCSQAQRARIHTCW